MAADPNSDTVPTSLSLDTSVFRREVSNAESLGKGLSRTLTRAFADVAVSGKSLGDVVGLISQRLARLAISNALKPLEQGFGDVFKSLTKGVGGLFGGEASAGQNGASGGAGDGASLFPFAQGGVISSPTFFPLGGGRGLAGEAGAEAILPLGRGPDGRLGVRGLGGGADAANITVNIQTPDVEGFRRSEAEVAASIARLVGRGRRSL